MTTADRKRGFLTLGAAVCLGLLGLFIVVNVLLYSSDRFVDHETGKALAASDTLGIIARHLG